MRWLRAIVAVLLAIVVELLGEWVDMFVAPFIPADGDDRRRKDE